MLLQEMYTFHWHSYSDHLREVLREMMTSSEFADVTLVTDDKQQIRAHRSILSACSQVFENILQLDTNNTNPVIYLSGVQHSEMESIMQFIYLGEARFYEKRMSEFLMVSKSLEIKDLSTCIEMNDKAFSNEVNTDHDTNIPDDNTIFSSLKNEDCTNVEHQARSKPIIRNQSANRTVGRTEVVSVDSKFLCQDCERIFNNHKALSYHIKSKHEGITYACNQCHYQAPTQSSLKLHIQSIHEGVKYACYQCNYQSTQQGHLVAHIQSIHEGVRYACNQCDYKATFQNALRTHIKRKHF